MPLGKGCEGVSQASRRQGDHYIRQEYDTCQRYANESCARRGSRAKLVGIKEEKCRHHVGSVYRSRDLAGPRHAGGAVTYAAEEMRNTN